MRAKGTRAVGPHSWPAVDTPSLPSAEICDSLSHSRGMRPYCNTDQGVILWG